MIELLAPLYIETNQGLEQILESRREMPVQLSFHSYGNFKKLEHEKIKSALSNNGITVKSIHFPSIGLTHRDFLKTLWLLQETYHQNLFTIHPQREKPEQAMQKLDQLADEIYSRGIILAFENFPTRNKKWIETSGQISRLQYPFTGLTFDTSHADYSPDIMDQMINSFPRIKVVHLSDNYFDRDSLDRIYSLLQHLPVGFGNLPMEDILKFLQVNYDGQVVLDYGVDFLDELKEHMKTLPEKLDRDKLKTRMFLKEDSDDSEEPSIKVFYNQDKNPVRIEYYSEDGEMKTISYFATDFRWGKFHWTDNRFDFTRFMEDWEFNDYDEYGDFIKHGYCLDDEYLKDFN